MLNAPDVYMDKIAIGPGYPKGLIDLDASPADNINALAKAKGVKPNEITALIMDRPRHAELIKATRATGASVALITDATRGVIHTTEPEETGIDIYLGIGGAPEGVLAAAALRCIGGQMQGRLILDTDEKRSRAQDGRQRPEQEIRYERDGARRLPDRGHRRHHRLDAARRGVQGRPHFHAHGRDALGHRHHALDRCRAPAARKIPSVMPKPAVLIREIGADERAAWEPLWQGYLQFYEAAQTKDATDETWRRIHDPKEPMFALGAYVGGELLGIVHYLFHRSFWTTGDYCYLQDLFVAKDTRGLGLGRALIEAVYAKAKAAGASRVHWLTQEHNATARRLYDNIADRSGFIQYRKIF